MSIIGDFSIGKVRHINKALKYAKKEFAEWDIVSRFKIRSVYKAYKSAWKVIRDVSFGGDDAYTDDEITMYNKFSSFYIDIQFEHDRCILKSQDIIDWYAENKDKLSRGQNADMQDFVLTIALEEECNEAINKDVLDFYKKVFHNRPKLLKEFVVESSLSPVNSIDKAYSIEDSIIFVSDEMTVEIQPVISSMYTMKGAYCSHLRESNNLVVVFFGFGVESGDNLLVITGCIIRNGEVVEKYNMDAKVNMLTTEAKRKILLGEPNKRLSVGVV